MTLSADEKTMTCVLDTVPPNHQLHFNLGHKQKLQYRKTDKEELAVLNEVHLFIPADNTTQAGTYALSLDKIQKIEVIVHDKKRTTDSYVIGAIGYTLGAAALVGIIVAATKSSCPFVSAYDGKEFNLQGEIYGGAIYPQLARHDYLPLKMAPLADGTLQLKITNELQERQYTDIAELIVIEHDKNTKALSDENGNFYSVSDKQTPLTARLNSGRDVLSAVNKAGDNEICYMEDSTNVDSKNELLLSFNNPGHASKGKLILTLKNSYWLDLLYGELAKGFGTYYASYIKKQRNKTPEQLLKWVKEQQIPLSISVKSKTGWQDAAHITTIGPLASRQIVVPLDINKNSDEIVEIKLAAGFMFWEIDHAAIDFSEDKTFSVQRLMPQKATDEKGNSVLAQLLKEDGIYLEQPEIGNAATIVYVPATEGHPSKTKTYLLHAKGYYEHIRNFKNKPDINFLNRFTKPNAFPVYGMQLYQKLKKENLRLMASAN